MVKFAVIEFVGEKAVEIVVENWIETHDGALYCYWPRTSASKKVKNCEMPDKETWKKYKIRVFAYVHLFQDVVCVLCICGFTCTVD